MNNRTRNNLIKVYLSDEEYKIMKEKKEASGSLTISLFIRRLIVKGEVIIYDLKSLLTLSEQIGRVGNNINQIARKLNLNENGDININNKKSIEEAITLIKLSNQALLDIYKLMNSKL